VGGRAFAQLISRQFRRWRVRHTRSPTEALRLNVKAVGPKVLLVDMDPGQRDEAVGPADLLGWIDGTVRSCLPSMPVALLSMAPSPELINHGQRIGCQVWHKQGCLPNIQELAERLELAEETESWRRAAYLDWLRDHCKLTETHLEVAQLALQGLTRDAIAAETSRNRHTVKTHLDELRRRAGVPSIAALREQASRHPVPGVGPDPWHPELPRRGKE